MLDAFHDRFPSFHLRIYQSRVRRRVKLVRDKSEFRGTFEQDVERGFELEAGLEDGGAAEDVEAEAGTGQGDGEAADVAEVADAAGSDER
jgi:hypothetical protein